MELREALSLARAAKAIDSENRDVPANAALVVLAREFERLQKRLESTEIERRCAKCRGDGVVVGPSDSGYYDCPACDGKGF